jgi:hypothetical protein
MRRNPIVQVITAEHAENAENGGHLGNGAAVGP